MSKLMWVLVATLICLSKAFRGLSAGRVTGSLLRRGGAASLRAHVETPTTLNPRDERRRILSSPNYNRMGFKEEKLDVEKAMSSEFTSPLVAELRANKGTITRGNVTIKLAEFYGFCWGVERAVRRSRRH